MKRLIKFRGKSINGQWAYGSLIKFDIGYVILTNEKTETNSKLGVENCIVFSEEEIEVVTSGSIGQFTGLLDKNGKEVYEWDIIRGTNGRIGTICWDERYLQWFTRYNSGESVCCVNWYPCEVIGNVFDNPVLLKGGSPD